MPASLLRSALEDFLPGASPADSHAPGSFLSCSDPDALLRGGPLSRGLGRHLGHRVRATSFIFDSFRENRTCEAEAAKKVIAELDTKVDKQLHHMKDDMERKLDQFFKTMREAYGVSFGSPALLPPVRGAVSSTAGSSGGASGGAEHQPWESSKIKFRLPDLPPGKHATIQLEHRSPIPVTGEHAGTQEEALGSLIGRLNRLMRTLSGQPPEEDGDTVGSEQHPAQGSTGDLYNKLRMMKDSLDGVYMHDHEHPPPADSHEEQLNDEKIDPEDPLATKTEASLEEDSHVVGDSHIDVRKGVTVDQEREQQ